MTALITDPESLPALAAARQDAFEVLLHQLQWDDDIDDARLDAYVEQLAAPIRAAVDCTQCANCCRSIEVYIQPEDIPVLAQGVGRPVDEVQAEYVCHAADPEEMRLRARPCRLLNGRLCGVYAHRPQSCRDYPAFAPDFRWTLENTIAGAAICPIIYNTLLALLERLDSKDTYEEISQ